LKVMEDGQATMLGWRVPKSGKKVVASRLSRLAATKLALPLEEIPQQSLRPQLVERSGMVHK
jgi:hypothetical protein